MSVDEISQAKMLKPGVAPELKERVEADMKNIERELDEITPKLEEFKQKQESMLQAGQEAHRKMKDAQKGKQELDEAKNKVTLAKRKLREAEKEISKDNCAEKKEIKKALRQNVEKYLTTLETASLKHDEYLRASAEIAGIELTEEGKRQRYFILE